MFNLIPLSSVILVMQASACETAYIIYLHKSCEKRSSLPFLCLLANCSVWAVYGALRGDLPLLLPNLSGVVVGMFNMTISFDIDVL